MRHLVATKEFRAGFVEMLPACVGLVPFGVVCGVGAAAAGADWLAALGMALFIFSGAAQILAVQLYAANAPAAIRKFDASEDTRAAGVHFLGSGIAVWSNWVATNMVGYFAGASIPPSWSLDFAVPLCFIALVAPLFRSLPSVVAAVAAGVAVLALAGLPMRLSLIAAGLIGIVAGTVVDFSGERWKAR